VRKTINITSYSQSKTKLGDLMAKMKTAADGELSIFVNNGDTTNIVKLEHAFRNNLGIDVEIEDKGRYKNITEVYSDTAPAVAEESIGADTQPKAVEPTSAFKQALGFNEMKVWKSERACQVFAALIQIFPHNEFTSLEELMKEAIRIAKLSWEGM